MSPTEDDDSSRDHGRAAADSLEQWHGFRSHAAHRRADGQREGFLHDTNAPGHPRDLHNRQRLANATTKRCAGHVSRGRGVTGGVREVRKVRHRFQSRVAISCSEVLGQWLGQA